MQRRTMERLLDLLDTASTEANGDYDAVRVLEDAWLVVHETLQDGETFRQRGKRVAAL